MSLASHRVYSLFAGSHHSGVVILQPFFTMTVESPVVARIPFVRVCLVQNTSKSANTYADTILLQDLQSPWLEQHASSARQDLPRQYPLTVPRTGHSRTSCQRVLVGSKALSRGNSPLPVCINCPRSACVPLYSKIRGCRGCLG